MAGTERAFERPRQLLDVDPGLEAGRIELVVVRREEDVDAGVLGDARVALLVARVLGEVLARRELRAG